MQKPHVNAGFVAEREGLIRAFRPHPRIAGGGLAFARRLNGLKAVFEPPFRIRTPPIMQKPHVNAGFVAEREGLIRAFRPHPRIAGGGLAFARRLNGLKAVFEPPFRIRTPPIMQKPHVNAGFVAEREGLIRAFRPHPRIAGGGLAFARRLNGLMPFSNPPFGFEPLP